MTESSSSGATHEPQYEETSGQRTTRRQVAYSLTAVMAALTVAAFGFVFAYESITESSHVHAAESESNSHEDIAAIEETMDMASLDEIHEEPAHDNDAEHASHEDASEDHGHSSDE